MNECKPVMSTGLSVLTSSTEEGGEIRDHIPSSTCEKDRNEGALLPGADVSRALWRRASLGVPGSQRKTVIRTST